MSLKMRTVICILVAIIIGCAIGAICWYNDWNAMPVVIPVILCCNAGFVVHTLRKNKKTAQTKDDPT